MQDMDIVGRKISLNISDPCFSVPTIAADLQLQYCPNGTGVSVCQSSEAEEDVAQEYPQPIWNIELSYF